MSVARAVQKDHLESLLRVKKLDHTVTTLEPVQLDARWLVPTAIPALDERLRGGFPRGHVSEVVGARSAGCLTVTLSMLAAATARGEAVAYLDPLDMLDPPSAAASGIDFSRVLWVRGEPVSAARVSLSCEYGTLQKSLDRAVKSLNLLLQAGGFGVVVLDLAEMSPQVLQRLPFTTWLRLHRLIEGSETACLLMGAGPISRSAGGVTLQLGASSDSRRRCGVFPPRSVAQPGGTDEVRQITARVVRARSLETADVCVPVSAAAC